jgi:chromosomal replication initiator protein
MATMDTIPLRTRKFIKPTIIKKRNRRFRFIDINRFVNFIYDRLDMDETTVNMHTRKRRCVEARQIAMFFCVRYLHEFYSYSDIGSVIGKKDHATVIHSMRTVQNHIETERSYRERIEDIDKKLRLIFNIREDEEKS